LGFSSGLIIANIWNAYCVFIKYDWEKVSKIVLKEETKSSKTSFSNEPES